MSETDAALTDQKPASRRGVAARREPDAVDRRLINALQGDFPVLEAPFAAVGASLGLTESEVIQRLQAIRLMNDHCRVFRQLRRLQIHLQQLCGAPNTA